MGNDHIEKFQSKLTLFKPGLVRLGASVLNGVCGSGGGDNTKIAWDRKARDSPTHVRGGH